MHCIETIATTWGKDDRFEAVIEILPDEDATPPDECDCEPVLVRPHNTRDLAKELAAAFGRSEYSWDGISERARRIAQRLASGEVFKDDDGTWYYGVAEYRHSGSAFTLCCSQRHRNFPDKRWDVIGLCGWIKITRQNRIDWGIHGRKGVEESARINAKGAREAWEAYLNGWFAGYKVALREDGALVDEDSCWGFQGIEDAKEAARGTVMDWQNRDASAGETGRVAP